MKRGATRLVKRHDRMAGALKVPLADYLIGTALGLAPGLLAMSLLGDQLARIVANARSLNQLSYEEVAELA